MILYAEKCVLPFKMFNIYGSYNYIPTENVLVVGVSRKIKLKLEPNRNRKKSDKSEPNKTDPTENKK